MSAYVVPGDSGPCRSCAGSGLAGLCLLTEFGSDGACVLSSGHHGPCSGPGDVAGDWVPALPCRTCCVCPCGSSNDGTSPCPYCGVQMCPGVDPPVFDPSTHRPKVES